MTRGQAYPEAGGQRTGLSRLVAGKPGRVAQAFGERRDPFEPVPLQPGHPREAPVFDRGFCYNQGRPGRGAFSLFPWRVALGNPSPRRVALDPLQGRWPIRGGGWLVAIRDLRPPAPETLI